MRLSTAYHEAGHALMAVLCGLELGLVGIASGSEDRSGLTITLSGKLASARLRGTDTEFNQAVENQVLYLLAGPAAQKVHNKLDNYTGGSGDARGAVSLLSRVCNSEAEIERRSLKLMRRAYEILNKPENRCKLERLAAVINERGRLTGAEVERLVV